MDSVSGFCSGVYGEICRNPLKIPDEIPIIYATRISDTSLKIGQPNVFSWVSIPPSPTSPSRRSCQFFLLKCFFQNSCRNIHIRWARRNNMHPKLEAQTLLQTSVALRGQQVPPKGRGRWKERTYVVCTRTSMIWLRPGHLWLEGVSKVSVQKKRLVRISGVWPLQDSEMAQPH